MLKKVVHWIYYFLTYAVIGWVFETLVIMFLQGRFELRGVLFVTDFAGLTLFWGFPAIAIYG
ncbi:MAG: hypothetical protein LBM09_02270, partial [Candidatus Nomurabacteria bacterium]|nr:hypothetical protein [Candidatus Nomurabacteria bacterium]